MAKRVMLQNGGGNPTAQQKIIAVNDNFGNPGMKKQQGSTIEVYDSVKLAVGQLQYDFFINAKAKQYPFTNLTDGKLQPQESFELKRAFFALITMRDADNSLVSVEQLDLAAHPGFASGEIEFYIVNQRVIRPLSIRSFFPQFNADADHALETVKLWDTKLVIPPLLEFKCSIKFQPQFFTAPGEGQSTYLFMTIGGPGGIFAPKNNF